MGKTVVEFDGESRRQLTRTIYIQRVGDSRQALRRLRGGPNRATHFPEIIESQGLRVGSEEAPRRLRLISSRLQLISLRLWLILSEIIAYKGNRGAGGK